jgi:hypothetical protein
MSKFTDQQVVDFVLAKTEGSSSAQLEKKLTDDTWTVLVSIEDGLWLGVMTYKFRTAYVDVSGEAPRIMGLWT